MQLREAGVQPRRPKKSFCVEYLVLLKNHRRLEMPLWNCTGWGEEHGEEEEEEFTIRLYSFGYHEFGSYVVVAGFALISGLAKIAFHHTHFLSSRIPESW